jgi:hypothetical protein
MLVLLMEKIYGLWCWDGVKCHDMHTRLHKNWFKSSIVSTEDTHRQQCDPIHLKWFDKLNLINFSCYEAQWSLNSLRRMKSVSETKCAHSSKCRKTVSWETPNSRNRHTKTEIKLQENWDKTSYAVRLWNAKSFRVHGPFMGHLLITDRTFRSQFLQFNKPQQVSRAQKVAFYLWPYFISTYPCESAVSSVNIIGQNIASVSKTIYGFIWIWGSSLAVTQRNFQHQWTELINQNLSLCAYNGSQWHGTLFR